MTRRDFELLTILGRFRPLDYRVQIIAPDGSFTHDERFGTREAAERFASANRGTSDVVLIQHSSSESRN